MVPILFLVVAVIVVVYFLLNRKTEEELKEGIVKDILRKDALSIDFGEGQPVVVKLQGIIPAVDGEMLDEKIFAFLEQSLRGQKVMVKPVVVESGSVMSAEVRTPANEYVNSALVRQGFARWQVSEASGDTEIAEAQALAQKEQLGVWNPAIMQLLEDRRKAGDNSDMTDDDVANMQVNPDDLQTKG